ncbi:MAG: hypothetical protein UHS54_09345 [Lachnospiraceae bacterium]|nr:hypothetical protein [Lachnospiraceae bacterium]
MGYKRAEEILPVELIELIQQYVDGQNRSLERYRELLFCEIDRQ